LAHTTAILKTGLWPLELAVASLVFESEIIRTSGLSIIAGLDEAGRGALAGPVVAAAVIFPTPSQELLRKLSDVNDSKQLSATKRAQQFEIITETAVAFGIGQSSAQIVDQCGIISATKQAMLEALQALKPAAEYLLIDGRLRLIRSPLPQQSIIRGDSKSLSIAAASILAKVTRDRTMIDMDHQYPKYGFAQNKGYGTAKHREALERYGPSAIHRLTFAPLRATLI
jgi:ribonuclease HII